MTTPTGERVRARLGHRLIAEPLQFGRDWLVRFVELQGFDRAVALGGQAFTALIPMLIVYAALVSDATGRDFAAGLIRTLGLSGSSADALRQVFAPADDVESQVSVLGGVLLVGSALSFTRALQRLYQFAWEQPSLGLRATKWGLIWLAIAIVTATVRPAVVSPFDGVARVVVSIALNSLLWLVTPYVLLARRVAWRRLVATALLTAFAMTALAVSSALWMPRTVSSSAAQFGTIGVAFALLTWLVGAGMVLVATAAGGALISGPRRARGPGRHPPG